VVGVRPMLKLAIQSRLVPGRSLREKHENALRYGFDGIELFHFPMIEAAEEALRDGVPASAMCSGHRGWFIDPDPDEIRACLEDVKRLLELGAELDAPLIVVPIFGRTNALPGCGTGRSLDEDRELWRRGLREATEHAERVGSRLLVEAINRYENPLSIRLADAVGWAEEMKSPNVRAMADVFHMNIEEADLGASLERAGSMLAYVHLADSQRLEPGLGHLDFGSVFGGLARIGYDGWASLECNLSGDAEDVLPRSAAFLQARMASVPQLAGTP
jgi:sugar phosphate isomerase/epimerase